MSSKRLFSWSKRHSGAEPYYRTGGLLPIDTSEPDPTNTIEPKHHLAKSRQRRPTNLTIVPPDSHQFVYSPVSSPHNAVLASASSNLFAIFNDMLCSPTLGTSTWPRSTSVHKPLPSRPRRSASAPSTPDLPVELPGSLLQDNQGYPSSPTAVQSPSARPNSQYIRRESHPPDRHVPDDDDPPYLLELLPRPLNHAKSVPSLVSQYSTMRPARAVGAPSSSIAAAPNPAKVQHRKSLSDMNQRGTAKLLQPSTMAKEGRPRLSAVSERTSRRDDLSASKSPTPTATRSKQTSNLKATVTTQDQTISTLKAQLASVQASHQAHAASLADSHAVQVASLQNQATLLEKQLAERPSLNHTPSNTNFLFLLDTPELPQTPSRESSQNTVATSVSSTEPSQAALEKQQRWSRRPLNSPDMESLKRKLTNSRRPEPTTRNLLPELNQYKQNNVALQTQIGSLMAKLNDSRRNEKSLKATLQNVEQKCLDWEQKASTAEELAKNATAFQNTVDHLEHRLEMANMEKLDAEEELFNLRMHRSPFGDETVSHPQGHLTVLKEPPPVLGPDASTSTVFSNDAPSDHRPDTDEPTKLTTFITHIASLQDQIRQKDMHISELQADREYLRQRHGELEQERDGANLELEIQTSLLGQAQHMDRHIEQLRTAVIDREAIIGQKEKSVCAVEKQLELHKLLLLAEIRKHAAMTRHDAIKQEPLPELSTLAKKKDIDRWIQKLNQRLKSEKPVSEVGKPVDTVEAQVRDLQDEIEFYVREIIYYKLDIRGYKSDIKKLKKTAAQLTNPGSMASDLESDTSSLRPATTSRHTRRPSATPELGSMKSPSVGPVSSNMPYRPVTPPQAPHSGSTITPGQSPVDSMKPTKDYFFTQYEQKVPMTPQSMGSNNVSHTTDKTDKTSPKYEPDYETFGGLSTSFPLNSPIIPEERHPRRSMSESLIQLHDVPTPEKSSSATQESTATIRGEKKHVRGRSASRIEPDETRPTPERPLRPQYGLFESPDMGIRTIISPGKPPRIQISTEPIDRFSGYIKTIDRTSIDTEITDIAAAFAAFPLPTSTKKGTLLPPLPVPGTRAPPQHGSAGSDTSGMSDSHQQVRLASPPERKHSISSDGSNIPFVMAMGAPHNPALFVAAKNMPPEVRSSTQKRAPMMSAPSTSRTGVGGTMASSAPTMTSHNPLSPAKASPHTRAVSLPFNNRENMHPQPPRTPAHSRNASTNSIRTAIRLPKGRARETDAQKIRKESISMPRPLDSPFHIDQSIAGAPLPTERDTGNEAEKAKSGDGLQIGEAI